MTHYFKTGNTINIEPSDALEVLDNLPAATYIVKKNGNTGKLYLQTTSNFELPAKIYGNPGERVARIKTTFNSRTRSTGILLSGDKGSGKTLLSKSLANVLIADNVPVIVVNEAWCGQAFNELIGHINQPAMVLFDEFDKVYDKEEQQELLTLLDGTVETKKLFVLTTNSGHVDEHLLNRPGRIYYKFNYSGVDESFVREYANDVLVNKDHLDSLVVITNTFAAFTFDMLQTLIEEMNRYGESAEKAIENLNIDITNESVSYSVNVLYNGNAVTNTFWPKQMDVNPLFTQSPREIEFNFDDGRTLTDKMSKGFPDLILCKEHLLSIKDGGTMIFKYNHGKNDVFVVVERFKQDPYAWKAY